MPSFSIPNLSLVVLIGPSGSGKSTFARKHFLPTEVLSSDYCRGLVSDDENNQAATNDAFDVLHFIAAKRLGAGRLTVVDATNVQRESRQPLVALARVYHTLPVAIVFNLPEDVCQERNRGRSDRDFGPHVIRNQRSQLRRSLKALKREGFRHIFVFDSPEQVEAAVIERTPLWNDKRSERGPFDFIGDVHGCCDELEELLVSLGYEPQPLADPGPGWTDYCFAHPEGRKAAFVGDLVDRGPRVLDTLSLVRNMMAAGSAICVPGNHDAKLLRKLRGKNVQLTHGLAGTMEEIEAVAAEEQDAFRNELSTFLDSLVSHYVLDDGKIVVAHAGMKESMQGRGSGKVREFALYGETTGETDEFGLPVRYPWASEYRGGAMVVYGHTPVPTAEWLNKTINIDTGCVFGGALTALRYPELETVSVKAKRTYCEPSRPFLEDNAKSPAQSSQQANDDLLDLADVTGKRIVSTRLRPNITIREENGVAALEVMSRFAADPRWLVYLPPTMSPSETSTKEGYLEYPEEALGYFRSQGVPTVVCEEKHMGSRAVVVVCRDEEVAAKRFGVQGEAGVITTRTGRRFFNDLAMEAALLERVRAALSAAGFWEEHQTEWVVLDCELMPWSAKAKELVKSQYAAVGAAAKAALPPVVDALRTTAKRLNGEASELLEGLAEKFGGQRQAASRFVDAYRHYCWPVESVEDYRLAPFHLLATEGRVHVQQNHEWHMQSLAKVCRQDPRVLLATPYRVIDVTDPEQVNQAVRWWTELTEAGGEGMVVKPLDFISRGKRGLLQPAVKCRGREYLRIIYGPDYTSGANLTRLRSRGLGAKRSLALREFALGIEALERLVRREPLRRVHECVFGVLALESEPVDPRL
ncbi:polynucleotide kinase-phosphatase [Botrimarina mediterranea]|uniref:Bis(5'-nucleosyl)-tetraphosphatase PrpE [asymmetrical] n=1 Tax=Botrimarina mediterranea TaxID=2528022 RepID=A0A518K7T7_9BACT|nr:polynucleotide kinase-phosphatase [Botrimarina mediterranea]QDV73845.1 Bis(5'-nucleosyl)-tetraphosphatase PrpE [asymmetrical] [Botrimarina mediterranea]